MSTVPLGLKTGELRRDPETLPWTDKHCQFVMFAADPVASRDTAGCSSGDPSNWSRVTAVATIAMNAVEHQLARKVVAMESGGQRLRWRKRLLFNLVLLIGMWGFIEAFSYVAVRLFLGSSEQLVKQQQGAAAEDPFQPGGQFAAPGVIHPYIGMVMQPRPDQKLTYDDKYRVTEFGFIDDNLPIHKRSPDKVIIAILGGSVARQLGMNATQVIAAELAQSPEFAGKKFEFVRLGSNGYKQPQQLMTMNFLTVLGAEFDIVINLDGFNEAALPEVDNVPFGVNAAYPRDWGKLIAGTASPEFVRMGGYVTYQRDEAQWFAKAPWKYSPTALLVWGIRKNRSDRLIRTQTTMMSRYSETERTYCGSGPPEHFESTADVYNHCIDIWSRSSLLLNQLCLGRGIRYYHFLQPNQYLPGSKPIGAQEAKTALDETGRSCLSVRTCFPLMQARGAELVAAGVTFTDLTQVFADHPEPIYNDVCCHVVPAGDEIMAKAIAARIKKTSR
jgi:hypothetical protein